MSRLRIWVCEPDPQALRVIAQVLEADGYDVSTAQGWSSAAWDEALSQRPSMAILGTFGPDHDDAARRVACDGVPFVVMVGQGQGFTEHAVATGAMACFLKPFDVRLLIPSIPVWIARAAELEHLRGQQQSMQKAVRSNRDIGAAVGVLMERHGLTANDAFDTLRQQARRERLRVVTVATAIVAGAAR
jgi:two-component system, response regulator PdtaR